MKGSTWHPSEYLPNPIPIDVSCRIEPMMVTHLVADKKKRQLKSIPHWRPGLVRVSALLNTRDIEITNTSKDDLLQKLASGIWTAVDVTTAFYRRAIAVHQLVSRVPESASVMRLY